jgi:hypothetical protein
MAVVFTSQRCGRTLSLLRSTSSASLGDLHALSQGVKCVLVAGRLSSRGLTFSSRCRCAPPRSFSLSGCSLRPLSLHRHAACAIRYLIFQLLDAGTGRPQCI